MGRVQAMYRKANKTRDGLAWCEKDQSSQDEYECPFCNGTGCLDVRDGLACEMCGGSGSYQDICCDWHAEQELKEEHKNANDLP